MESAMSALDIFDYKNNQPSLEFSRFIGDRETELLEVLNSEESYNLIADTNSGKTYSMIDICCRHKIKAIILVPLQMIAIQKHEEYKNINPKAKLGLVHGEIINSKGQVIKQATQPKEIKKLINNKVNVFICVYDSLPKFFIEGTNFRKEFTLIIDESHNLVTQYNFRFRTINYIIDSINEGSFKKFIYMTATPEGTLLKGKNTVILKRREDAQLRPIELYIIKYNRSNGLHALFNHITSQNYPGKVIVLIDNKNSLLSLERALVAHYEDKDIVKILMASNKDSDVYLFISKQEQIPPHVKFLLSTRVISDGANIRSKTDDPSQKISAVYMLNIPDPIMKRQFIGRVRDDKPVVFDFLNYGKDRELSWDNIKNVELDQKAIYGETVNSKNNNTFEKERALENIVRTRRFQEKRNKNDIRKENHDEKQIKSQAEYIYFSGLSNKFNYSEEYGRFEYLEKVNKFLLLMDSTKLMEYYKRYTDYIVLPPCTLSEQPGKLKYKRTITGKKFNEIAHPYKYCDEQLHGFILNNFKELLATYSIKHDPTYLFNKAVDRNLFPEVLGKKDLVKEYGDHISKRTCFMNTINSLHGFIIEGYTYEFIILALNKLFQSNSGQNLSRCKDRLDYYFYSKIIRDKENQWFIENRNLLRENHKFQDVLFAIENFVPNDVYNISEAKECFYKYVSENGRRISLTNDRIFKRLMTGMFSFPDGNPGRLDKDFTGADFVPDYQSLERILFSEGITDHPSKLHPSQFAGVSFYKEYDLISQMIQTVDQQGGEVPVELIDYRNLYRGMSQISPFA